jgi:CMP-N-acetylneuraminic acid synthetase
MTAVGEAAVGYLGLIPARGGSKGVRRKNLAEVGGKPLVQRTIEAGQASRRLDALVVSSEDAEILELARSLGCDVVERPGELAADDAPMIGTALHALEQVDAENLVLLQPTSPFRDGTDIDAAIDTFERSGAPTLASVGRVDQHPCNCVRRVGDRLERAVPLPRPDAQRQDFPEFHYLDGAIFVARVAELRASRVFVDERTALHVLEPTHALDVNGPLDLALAQAVAERVA